MSNEWESKPYPLLIAHCSLLVARYFLSAASTASESAPLLTGLVR